MDVLELKIKLIDCLYRIGVHPDIIINALATMELNKEYDFIGSNVMQAAASLNAARAIKEGAIQDVQS